MYLSTTARDFSEASVDFLLRAYEGSIKAALRLYSAVAGSKALLCGSISRNLGATARDFSQAAVDFQQRVEALLQNGCVSAGLEALL